MTDSIPTASTLSMIPERLRIDIQDLWRLSMRSEERVHRSGAFRALEDTCLSVYLGLKESRLQRIALRHGDPQRAQPGPAQLLPLERRAMVWRSDSRRRRYRRIAAPCIPAPIRPPHLSRSAGSPFT